ncbi:MAG: hypothetical protein CMC45_02895 [Flavobacteriaceae bacterium]|nr:hypothetical protein [Flavobacteriaceae bacterium]
MIRQFIKYGFYLTLPLLAFTLLMKFRVIDQYLNTDYLFPIISVLFFLEIYCRGSIDKRK